MVFGRVCASGSRVVRGCCDLLIVAGAILSYCLCTAYREN